jgi:hypothetical protein
MIRALGTSKTIYKIVYPFKTKLLKNRNKEDFNGQRLNSFSPKSRNKGKGLWM